MTAERSQAYFFTPRGIERLRKRIDDARRAYKTVCEDNPEARESGDSSVWHDNFAFEENQRQMHQLARRVRDLEAMLSSAIVVLPHEAPPGRVGVGSRVTFTVDDDERCCTVVGYDDGDPPSNRLSYNSPLGLALLGASVGDEREVVLAGRTRVVSVVEIAPGDER